MRGDVCKTAEEVFREVMTSIDIKLMEMKLAKEHVHLFVSIPPKYSIGEVVRKLCQRQRGVFERHPEVKNNEAEARGNLLPEFRKFIFPAYP